jgi:hypothetical protein
MRTTSIVLLFLLCDSGAAHADEDPMASFVLIMGVNKSVDQDLQPLRYGDDDAVRYFALFRTLGARTFLLSRLDQNTARLYTQAAAEAREPILNTLRETVEQIAKEVEVARERNVKTALYVVYAGHGNTSGESAYITLEDARLTSKIVLDEVIDPIGAHSSHVIIDACYSYYMAFSRGPGGSRRPIKGFSNLEGLAGREDLGLLLSISTGRDSHEWEAYQAGVFSHEVRSGLYGAADADHNGWISYREIAAFVEQANRAVPNDRYRPRVFARPPLSSEYLVSLPETDSLELEVNGSRPAHYFLEDSQGVRLMDFHNRKGHTMRLIRPSSRGSLYLHNEDDQTEYLISPTSGKVELATLTPHQPRTQNRGAAHHAFAYLFTLPFGPGVVRDYEFPGPELSNLVVAEAAQNGALWYDTAGWVSVGLAGAAVTSAVVLSVTASDLRSSAGQNPTHEEATDINRQIRDRNIAAVTLYGVAAGTAAAGILFLLMPDQPIQTGVMTSPHGDFVMTLSGEF